MTATVMVERVDAVSMAWDSTAREWILNNGTRRWFNDGKERLEQFLVQPAGRLHFNPDDLRKKQEKPDEMDYYSLKQFILDQQRAGQDVAQWQVDFYSKISFPFATVIVVLFGVPFSSVKRRGGVGVQLGISLLICFVYLILMKVTQVFGYNGDVNPLLTAWAANIFFLIGAVIVLVESAEVAVALLSLSVFPPAFPCNSLSVTPLELAWQMPGIRVDLTFLSPDSLPCNPL